MSVAVIAERAGVSVATVSRVLNNSPRVNPETAKLVQAVLKQLNYDPSAMRRGPRIGPRDKVKVMSVGVIAVGRPHEEWFRIPVFASAVAGVMRAAVGRGARVHMDEIVDASKGCAAVNDGTVDGAILFVSSDADPRLVHVLREKIPVVRVMGGGLTYPEIDQVRPDSLNIGQVAYRYLAGKGCRRVAFVSTRPDHEAFMLRAVGFSFAATAAGAALPDVLVTGAPQPAGFAGHGVKRCASLEEVAEQLARGPDRPDGVFVSQDTETIGLYPHLTRRGLMPGRDVTIVSCNNEAGLEMLSPRPATIEVGTEEIGRWAVQRLAGRIARPTEPPVHVSIAPRLVPGSDDVGGA